MQLIKINGGHLTMNSKDSKQLFSRPNYPVFFSFILLTIINFTYVISEINKPNILKSMGYNITESSVYKVSLQEIERMVGEVKMEDNLKDEILEIKNRLVETQIETQKLTEAHNLEKNQYVILKRRFDALDIEYAQLYEKFTSK